MRASRTATTLLGVAALLGLAAPLAAAKSVEPAWVHPAEAGPGQSVTVSVTCDTSSVKTITASSQAFSTGSATLTVGPDGKYSGKALLASKEEFAAKGGRNSSWGIDGSCPNHDTFSGAVEVRTASYSGAGAEAGKLPTGPMKTGLGGSLRTDPADLAAGSALVGAGIGGFWLLRRRTTL
ncbi:hypothetical protein KCMC57_up11420 [Kitasatospora sp. CMC57]|uniref:Uncharacterized protein n=1 Tax=Kitasatospora sp. CMC57 TaxID=3231513 RepID=A0AB33JRY1_9ACTN